ncbi:MAG: hypothetical protein EU542_04165 [Promethearchaeota archaeon]|nr:MAG: hypothetical protein EU542_04165 [Candidatus Lokiarchaeota archaeon]
MSLQKTREFLLKEKLFSIRDQVKIFNTNQQELGFFKGKIIKIGNTYRLYPIETPEKAILTVSEKIISMRSSYSFYRGPDKDNDKLIGQLKRKLVSIKPNYWFEDKEGNKLFTMKGNIWALKYKILLEGKEVAQINKKLFKIKGTYGVKMDPKLDDDSAMLILGIVVMLHHEKEEQK